MGESNINSKDFLIGTLIGGFVGAAAALLFAPKAGHELRGNLNDGATQLKGRAGTWKDAAYEKGSGLKDMAYEKGSNLKSKAADSKEKFTQKTQELTKNVQGKWNERKNQETAAEEAAEELADAIEEAAEEAEDNK
ncbi:YtxH domain-containing protein [Virgibacillus siamensis]|uniref:YtxH domain-containing protein n=1 Tax=Virgibacillus siamensis TaxID=480071 RepID=UPI000985BCA5|nr:YtxH domain-containing protein [Virgibacillus siamensis]